MMNQHMYDPDELVPQIRPYLSIWESELRFMVNVALSFGNIETGGDCFGLFSHAGRPVIVLSIPPGPEALHKTAHFRQDIEFMKKIFDFLSNTFGLNYIGNYHSHHNLGIKGLSGRDVESTHSIALKNGFHRMCQFVLTFDDTGAYNIQKHKYRIKLSKWGERLFFEWGNPLGRYTFKIDHDDDNDQDHFVRKHCVRMHSYFYSDATKGQPIRCPLKILPGKSPFRTALEHNQKIDIGMEYSQNADTKILYDIYKPTIETKTELPEKIHDQLTKLPENISIESKIKFDDEFILISIPLAISDNVVTVIYKKVIPFQIVGVFLTLENQNSNPVNLTPKILSRNYNCDLLEIYLGTREILENSSEVKEDSIEVQISTDPHNQSNYLCEGVHEDNGEIAGEFCDNTNAKEENYGGV